MYRHPRDTMRESAWYSNLNNDFDIAPLIASPHQRVHNDAEPELAAYPAAISVHLRHI